VTNWKLEAAGLCGMLLLGGCNVGSDEGQTPTASVNSQTVSAASVTGQISKPQPESASTRTELYYLVLHGLDAAGKRIGQALEFRKTVSETDSASVQLIWFEPNRKADGSCLRELRGYDLEYSQQPGVYNTQLTFDLASRDMTCSTVGTTECGDVRECRYNLTL
jgi:hypothetical protein